MRIAVARETEPGETRVALVPELVGRLTGAGYEVAVEPGAGRGALIDDQAYAAAGATVSENALHGAGLVLSVQPIGTEALRFCAPRAATVSFLFAGQRSDEVAARQTAGITTFAMEQVPRISRAQSMDALSSQALVAGYRAALVAAERLPRFFPLFMTAAGTVAPAKVLVLGAGVAGLQAIATAAGSARSSRRTTCGRLGRRGALDGRHASSTSASSRWKAPAATPARWPRSGPSGSASCSRRTSATPTPSSPPPRCPAGRHRCWSPRRWSRRCGPGSVVVDLAAESGGNCELSVPGEDVEHTDGVVQLWGMEDVAPPMPVHASQLYARNVVNLLLLMTADGEVVPDFDDEIVAGMCVTHRRSTRHEPADRERRPGGRPMSEAIDLLTFFVLAVFVGFEVVSKVSSVLHTPLMSGANAIHGVILVGAIIVAGHADCTPDCRSACSRWCSRRSTWSAGSWSPTGCCEMFVRSARPQAPTPARRWRRDARRRPGRAGLPGRRRLLHPRAQGPVLARAPPAAAT